MPAKKATQNKKAPRTDLTTQIVSLLEGKQGGVEIANIATMLGKKETNIYVWFSKHGKEAGVVRTAPGKLALAKHASEEGGRHNSPPPIINPTWITKTIGEHLTGETAKLAEKKLADALEKQTPKIATTKTIHKAILEAVEEAMEARRQTENQ